jgi:hypothetical protein
MKRAVALLAFVVCSQADSAAQADPFDGSPLRLDQALAEQAPISRRALESEWKGPSRLEWEKSQRVFFPAKTPTRLQVYPSIDAPGPGYRALSERFRQLG